MAGKVEELITPTEQIYKLYYARGINPRGELIFRLSGTLQDAIIRSRRHCERMNYKFVRCERFLVDLDGAEKEFEGGEK